MPVVRDVNRRDLTMGIEKITTSARTLRTFAPRRIVSIGIRVKTRKDVVKLMKMVEKCKFLNTSANRLGFILAMMTGAPVAGVNQSNQYLRL
jgi:hypothetical protein